MARVVVCAMARGAVVVIAAAADVGVGVGVCVARSGQVHDAGRGRVDLADGHAFQVRPVNGDQARPRGLYGGQLEVEQTVRHGAMS